MDSEKKRYARCIYSELDAMSIMKNMPVQTIQALLRRMGIDYVEGLAKEAYFIAFQDEFLKQREWLLRIFPKTSLELLLEIWESDSIEMDEDRWQIVQYFKSFGILTYKRSSRFEGEEDEIHIVHSMKKNFYFYLKSKECVKKMDEYERWYAAFCGMTYYYGMVPLKDLHTLFCQALRQDIPYDDFEIFVKCRGDVWGIGNFLTDSHGVEYFNNHNVEEPELTYLYLQNEKSLPYRQIDFQDIQYIKEGYGIDNRWAGISDLGNFLVEDMDISYYRATVLVHSILTAIHNSQTFEKIKDMLDGISFENQWQREKAEEYMRILYDHIPVYEYKGHSRVEYDKICKEREWQKRKERFIMIPGGK